VARATTLTHLATCLILNYRPPGMNIYFGRFLTAVIVLLCTGINLANGGEIRIAVAANFAPTLAKISRVFEEKTGHQVILASGSTGRHYAQIINGAPFDAFFAADATRPRLLEEAGLGVANSRYSYAVGRLVLWSTQPDLVDDKGAILSSTHFRRLAIANPRLAPYGYAAKEVLEGMLQWEKLQDKLVQGENINQTFQFVHSGNAQLGFIAASQLTGREKLAAGSHWFVPAKMYTPILQQAIQLTNSDIARQFMEFALTSEAEQIIVKNGYDLPHRVAGTN
jgi:molybdate transport system substrate-binding protein